MRYVFGKIFLGNSYSGSDNTWSSGTWENGTPNGINVTASLPANNTSNRVVTLDINVTLGSLILFGEAYSNSIAASGSNKITFESNTSNKACVYLHGSINSKPSIEPSLVLNSDLDVVQVTSGSSSVLCSKNIEATNKRLTKYGVGVVIIEGGGEGVASNPNWDGGYLTIKEGQFNVKYGAGTLGGSGGPAVEIYCGSNVASCDLHFDSFPAYPTESVITNSFSFLRNEDSTNYAGRIFTSGFPAAGQTIKFTGAWSGDLNPNGYINKKPVVIRGTNSYHDIPTRGFFLDNDLSGLTSTQDSDAPTLYSMAGGPVKFDSSITFPASGMYLDIGYKIAQQDSYGDAGFASNSPMTVPALETRFETCDTNDRLSTSPIIGSAHNTGTTIWEGDVVLNSNSGTMRIASFLHAEGESTCEFSGSFTGNGTYQPIIKTGSGIVKFSSNSNDITNTNLICVGGSINLEGSFTSSTNELRLGNPITRVNLNNSLISGDTLRITINGVNYTQLFDGTSDNTLKLLATQLSKSNVVASAYVTLVSPDFTSDEEREIVIIPLAVTGFSSVSTGRTGPGSASVTRSTSFPESILLGSGSFSGLVTLADSNGSGIEPYDFENNLVETLTLGSLFLRSSSYIGIYFESGANSEIQVNGNLTLNGTVELYDSDFLVAGTYDIIIYTGTLTNNGIEVGYVGNGLSASVNVDTVNKKIQVIVS
jgi:hypothetical protein